MQELLRWWNRLRNQKAPLQERCLECAKMGDAYFTMVTALACLPLRPSVISNSTVAPSSRVR